MSNLILERYLSGKQSEVWHDLMVLGSAVRSEQYYEDAVAVAAETMKRARHNVELIVPKLEKLGYRFTQDPDAPEQAGFYLRPDSDAEKAIREKYLDPGFVPQNTQEQAMVAKLRRIEGTKQMMNKHAGFFASLQDAVAARGRKAAPGKAVDRGSALKDPAIFRPAGSNATTDLDQFRNAPSAAESGGWPRVT
jgi:hypothetical protein